jgi:hypothetical protein
VQKLSPPQLRGPTPPRGISCPFPFRVLCRPLPMTAFARTFGNLRYFSAASPNVGICQFLSGNLGDFEARCGFKLNPRA